MAAKYGYLDILQYLEHEGILPNNTGAKYALVSGNFEIAEWLEQRGIVPPP